MKHTKKSLFITTVMMVVLLVVALSTATFAWYISNNTAMTNNTSLTSASSTDANIGIGWTAGSTGTSVSFDDMINLTPAIPNALPISNGSVSNINNSNDAQGAIYIAVDGTLGTGFVAGAVDGADYQTIYDLTDAQVLASKAPADLTGIPYYLTLSGAYERVYSTIAWHDNDTTQPTVGVATPAAGRDRHPIQVLQVVESAPVAGQCTTAQAYTYVGSYVAAGDWIFSYKVYNYVSYTATIPTGAAFEFFCTETAGAMNEDCVQKEDVFSKYHVTPSVTNRYVYCSVAAVSAGLALPASEAINFVNAPMNTDGYFTNNGSSATVAALNKLNDTGAPALDAATVFYVSNNSANPTGNITMTIATSGDNAAILRVAVFVSGKYVGTLATGTDTYYGPIFNTAYSTDSLGKYTAVSNIILSPLAASASHAIHLVAWYDGVMLDSGDSGKVAGFTINFTANAA